MLLILRSITKRTCNQFKDVFNPFSGLQAGAYAWIFILGGRDNLKIFNNLNKIGENSGFRGKGLDPKNFLLLLILFCSFYECASRFDKYCFTWEINLDSVVCDTGVQFGGGSNCLHPLKCLIKTFVFSLNNYGLSGFSKLHVFVASLKNEKKIILPPAPQYIFVNCCHCCDNYLWV